MSATWWCEYCRADHLGHCPISCTGDPPDGWLCPKHGKQTDQGGWCPDCYMHGNGPIYMPMQVEVKSPVGDQSVPRIKMTAEEWAEWSDELRNARRGARDGPEAREFSKAIEALDEFLAAKCSGHPDCGVPHDAWEDIRYAVLRQAEGEQETKSDNAQ